MENIENIWVAKKLVYVGPYPALQYEEVSKQQLEQMAMEAQILLEEEAQKHAEDCTWWHDWHACSCSAFDEK
jgi:hypothetical protein